MGKNKGFKVTYSTLDPEGMDFAAGKTQDLQEKEDVDLIMFSSL